MNSFRQAADPATARSKVGRPRKKSVLEEMQEKYGEGKMATFYLESGGKLDSLNDEGIKIFIKGVCIEKGWEV